MHKYKMSKQQFGAAPAECRANASDSVNRAYFPGRATQGVCTMAEVIFIQTDPTFNLVLRATRELRANGRLPVDRTTSQRAWTERIERRVEDVEDDCYFWRSTNNFARTASACIRMAMMEATGISHENWPDRQAAFNNMNTQEEHMHHHPARMPFQLTDDSSEARRYWSRFDQPYPANYITQKYRETELQGMVPLSSIIIIFRNNFTEMIEITTTVSLQKQVENGGIYHASVHVLCIKREIVPPGDDQAEERDFQLLQELCRTDNANIEGFLAEAIQQMDELTIEQYGTYCTVSSTQTLLYTLNYVAKELRTRMQVTREPSINFASRVSAGFGVLDCDSAYQLVIILCFVWVEHSDHIDGNCYILYVQ